MPEPQSRPECTRIAGTVVGELYRPSQRYTERYQGPPVAAGGSPARRSRARGGLWSVPYVTPLFSHMAGRPARLLYSNCVRMRRH